MLEKVENYIRQWKMLEKGDKVVVGLSGGADSVCLFLILEELRKKIGFEILAVHVNHGIRGEEAKADEEFVKTLCEKKEIPCRSVSVDIPKMAVEYRMSEEEAGRTARREIFEQAAEEWGGTRIALAHHQDDNAETFFLHLARGSGLRGLGGIYPVNGMYIRPLLCVGRKEIEDYLKGREMSYCIDATNMEDAYMRNRIRNHVIPYFKENINEKMSKSRGNVIYAEDLVKHFGVDAVRYYSLHEMPFAQDGTITYEVFISRFNSDLANTLGNLVNRTVAMINKYFDGEIQSGDVHGDFDDDLKAVATGAIDNIIKKMNTLHVADSMDEIWKVVDRANKYIDETTPWVLAKNEDDKARLGTVLYNLVETIRIIAALLSSYMPETSKKIAEQIGADDLSFESTKTFGETKAGTKVGEAVPLFQRIDAEKKLAELEEEFGQPEEEKIEIAQYK